MCEAIREGWVEDDRQPADWEETAVVLYLEARRRLGETTLATASEKRDQLVPN